VISTFTDEGGAEVGLRKYRYAKPPAKMTTTAITTEPIIFFHMRQESVRVQQKFDRYQ
jgi:hypothetical protein